MSYNSAWLDGYLIAMKDLKRFIEDNNFSDDEIVAIQNFVSLKIEKCSRGNI